MLSLQLATRGQLRYRVSAGYAVTAGHFSAPNAIDIAAGAPQHSGSGKVRSAPVVPCTDADPVLSQ